MSSRIDGLRGAFGAWLNGSQSENNLISSRGSRFISLAELPAGTPGPGTFSVTVDRFADDASIRLVSIDFGIGDPVTFPVENGTTGSLDVHFGNSSVPVTILLEADRLLSPRAFIEFSLEAQRVDGDRVVIRHGLSPLSYSKDYAKPLIRSIHNPSPWLLYAVDDNGIQYIDSANCYESEIVGRLAAFALACDARSASAWLGAMGDQLFPHVKIKCDPETPSKVQIRAFALPGRLAMREIETRATMVGAASVPRYSSKEPIDRVGAKQMLIAGTLCSILTVSLSQITIAPIAAMVLAGMLAAFYSFRLGAAAAYREVDSSMAIVERLDDVAAEFLRWADHANDMWIVPAGLDLYLPPMFGSRAMKVLVKRGAILRVPNGIGHNEIHWEI
jgi:hypothetical protein